jgi:hypothetical protein
MGVPFVPTRGSVDDLAAGRLKLVHFGKSRSYKLTKKQTVNYEAAKRRGYLVTVGSNQHTLLDVYYYWCEALRIPYLTVKKGRKYADVRMDVAPFLDGKVLHREAEAELRALMRRHAAPPCFIHTGEITWCDRVRIEKADEVARKLLEIAFYERLQA